MIRFLILFSIFTISPLWPKTQVTSLEFQKYIRPQINSLIQDFYLLNNQIILKSLPHNIELKNFQFKLLFTINEKVSNLKNCTYSQHLSDCSNALSSLQVSLQELSKFLIDYNFQSTPSVIISHANFLKFNSHFNEIPTLKMKLDYLNQQLSLLNLLGPINNTFKEIKYQNLLNKVFSDLEFFEIEIHRWIFKLNFQNYYENQLMKLWSQFIKILVSIYFTNESQLEKKYNDLNIIWNEFHHLYLRREGIKSSSTSSLVLTIHQRWNSILKIILKY
jgi:hypothetical protein